MNDFIAKYPANMLDIDSIGDYYLSSEAQEFVTESDDGESSYRTIECDISKKGCFYCKATFRLFEFNLQKLKDEFDGLSEPLSTDKEVEDFLEVGIVSDAFCNIQLLNPNKTISIDFEARNELEIEKDLAILLNWHWNHLRYRDAREILECVSSEIKY